MKTDRELLELAAKAAGMVSEDEHKNLVPLRPDQWNPLISSAEALALSAKLQIDVIQFSKSVEAGAFTGKEFIDSITVEVSGCRLSATRRAIVRAAAAIGEKL